MRGQRLPVAALSLARARALPAAAARSGHRRRRLLPPPPDPAPASPPLFPGRRTHSGELRVSSGGIPGILDFRAQIRIR